MFDPHHSIRSSQDLADFLHSQNLSWAECGLPPAEQIDQHWPLRIPYHYAQLIDWTNPSDPLRLMVAPTAQEFTPAPYELADPIGDHVREAVPGLIHRYPDRALLLLTSYCLVHCRFCFRKDVVGKVRPVAFDRILSYLKQHPEIQEVIFSGGDPFTFPTSFLTSVLQYLSEVPHLKIWRFHTRIPAVDPASVTAEWLTALQTAAIKAGTQVVVAIHINHPRELTPETQRLCQQLRQAGIQLLSQTVLLKRVNDKPETIMALFRSLIAVGIKPYYLHHLDQAFGTDQFRLSIAQGKKLMREIRGQLSGVAQPTYVIDLPGGHGKQPVEWLEEIAPGLYQTTSFEGKTVQYQDPVVFTPTSSKKSL